MNRINTSLRNIVFPPKKELKKLQLMLGCID